MCLGHDFQPGFIDRRESFRFLRQLFSDIAGEEDCLEIDPQVLHVHPVLDDFVRIG